MASGSLHKSASSKVDFSAGGAQDIARARASSAMDRQIGQRLREARLAKKLSLIELAELAKLAPQQVQKYETARTRVSASRLYQLAVLLERPVFWFFEER